MTAYAHRNGETQPPELEADEFSYYFFDGIAHYENWRGQGSMIVVTGQGRDRVKGLVFVAMLPDIKHPARDEHGQLLWNRATMIAIPETAGYDLEKCEGQWWGPVHVPFASDDLLVSMADMVDADEWTDSRYNQHL